MSLLILSAIAYFLFCLFVCAVICVGRSKPDPRIDSQGE
jgi:hypothetical protein